MWPVRVVALLSVTISLCMLVDMLSTYTHWGVPASLILSAGFCVYSIGQLSMMSNVGGPVGKLGAASRNLIKIFK